jgi:hypothetical protein
MMLMTRASLRTSRLLACAVALAGFTLGGCSRTVVKDPLETNYPVTDDAAELAFWHSLPSRSAVSNDEGLHGLLLLADGVDEAGSYEARVQKAKDRGWLSAGFDEEKDLAMRRGVLARCVVVICKIKGGVMLQALGPTERYSTRELGAMGVIPQGSSENQSITGLEYMSVIAAAQDQLNASERKSQREGGATGEPTAQPTQPTEPTQPTLPTPNTQPTEPTPAPAAPPAPAKEPATEPARMTPVG